MIGSVFTERMLENGNFCVRSIIMFVLTPNQENHLYIGQNKYLWLRLITLHSQGKTQGESLLHVDHTDLLFLVRVFSSIILRCINRVMSSMCQFSTHSLIQYSFVNVFRYLFYMLFVLGKITKRCRDDCN